MGEQWIDFKSQFFVFQGPPSHLLAEQPQKPRGGVGGGMTSRELTPFIMACEQSRADGISERLLFELIIRV